MATLEVHDGQGRVQFVELRRTTPSSSARARRATSSWPARGSGRCTGGFAGRRGGFKVEASPDAQYVLINGHKMTTSSLHQGDEMTVGPCRLFMLRLDEPLEAVPRPAPVRHRDEERTRVLEGPPPHARSAGRQEPTRPGRPASRRLGSRCWSGANGSTPSSSSRSKVQAVTDAGAGTYFTP